MAISRSELIQKVRNRLGEPMVKVELCDSQVSQHIDYARQKWIKWAIGNATQEVYFTLMLQAGKTLYDLPAGVMEVVEYDDSTIRSGGINTLFTIDNFMFSNGFYGNMFSGGYDLISYHLVLDFMETLKKYTPSRYNYKYHKSTNQIEINPAPPMNEGNIYRWGTDENGLPQEYVYDSPGFVMLRTYMIQGSTLPNYTPDWESTLREVKTVIEQRKITNEELANKSLRLNHLPAIDYMDKLDYNVPEDMKMSVGGLSKTKYVDWDQLVENRRVVTWEDLELESTLIVGDDVIISYPVLFQSNYYPDEWTSVTATSKEVEQFTVNQSHIDNSYVRVAWPVWGENVKLTIDGTTYDIDTDYGIDPLDPKVVSWKDLTIESSLEVGDQIVVSYVAARSQRPDSKHANQSIIRQYTTRIENRVLTTEEVTNKYLTLEEPVSAADGIKMVAGSFDKLYGVDFRLDSTQDIAWDSLGLDGSLNIGDPVVITYTSANYYEREVEEDLYDEDWILDYVTALSKMTLGIIRRKMENFASMGNQGISLDGSTMYSDGQTEKEYLETTLRDEEAHEGYGIEIGIM